MKWYVYYHNMNRKEISKFDIFKHTSFEEDVKKHLKTSTDLAVFKEKLESSLRYWFWCKSEYEVLISAWCGGNGEETIKVDIFSQVMLNFDVFAEYCWGFRKGKK